MSPSTCPSCGTDATGKFCPACGTPLVAAAPVSAAAPAVAPAAPERARSWLPLAVAAAVIVGLAGVAAAALLALGGSPDTPATATAAASHAETVDAVRLSAQNLYAPVEDAELTAVLPAGWKKRPAGDDSLTLGLTATSAQDRGVSVTLGVLSGDAGALTARARALREERRGLDGYRDESLRRLSLSGSRPAWKLQYETPAGSTVEYVWESCDRLLTVSGTAPERLFPTIAARFGVVARSLQPVC